MPCNVFSPIASSIFTAGPLKILYICRYIRESLYYKDIIKIQILQPSTLFFDIQYNWQNYLTLRLSIYYLQIFTHFMIVRLTINIKSNNILLISALKSKPWKGRQLLFVFTFDCIHTTLFNVSGLSVLEHQPILR